MAQAALTTVIDTSLVIWALNADLEVVKRLRSIDDTSAISAVTLVELQGGVGKDGRTVPEAKARIAAYLDTVEVLPFGTEEALAYGEIVDKLGFSRPRLADRMIAAQAIVAGARLVTINGGDFKGIPNLELEVWPSPA